MLLDIDDTERFSTLNNKRRLEERYSDNGTKDESSSGDETGLTENQNRLLYLLDLHTKKAKKKEDKDRWIRKQALSVFIYEGIVSEVFDYDYAPQSTLIDRKRVWLNISQDGQSDLEFLREEELINALMLSSSSHQTCVCYQISDKGRELIRNISRREKEFVDEFAHSKGTRELLHAVWDGKSYWIVGAAGYKRLSTITDTEDVSYVSSAYIPKCLRYGGRPTMSNAHKAFTSGFGAVDTIRDRELDEIITLNSVSLIVAEYIPFGSNQIVQLNNKIGSTDRVQGCYISPLIDNNSLGTSLVLTPDLTSVEILDYTISNHINFEAEIHFPENPGVIQVETFGISLNAEGTCFYGMQIEAVMDRIKDKISLDHLSRILVDVQEDSSKIVDSMISARQRDLMDLIFLGDAPNRNKINLIIANEITPHLNAEEYMDKGEYENELKQIIGDTKSAYDISERDTLVFGAHGLLMCGPHARSYEPLLCAYIQFITLDIFLQNFFSRMWILHDDLKATNKSIDNIELNPTSLERVRDRLYKHSEEIIQMDEVLGFVTEALEIMEIPPEPQEQAGRSLYQRLEISTMRSQLVRRNSEVQKIMQGSQRYLNVLRERVAAASENNIVQLYEGLEQNTKTLCTLQSSHEETVNSLRILHVIFAGMISFAILDRITGDWTVIDTRWMEAFVEAVIKGNALVWFLINIMLWIIVALVLAKLFGVMNWRSRGLTTIRIRVDERIDVDKLKEILSRKVLTTEESQLIGRRNIVKVSYQETAPKEWGGTVPTIILEYDEQNRYLLYITVQYSRRHAKKDCELCVNELKDRVMREFEEEDVFYIRK